MRTVAGSGRYFLAASLAAMALVMAGTAALYVTSAPAWVSLLVEPFSLLLLPGLMVALVTSGSHDFAPEAVFAVSVAFYVGFIYAALLRRAVRRRRAQLRAGGSR
jgi:hypothetical protein